jgi:two-component system NtrC family sensor kinase
MIRKSRIKPKEKAASLEIIANPGVDSKPDAPNIERVLFEGSPVPVAALAGPNHTLRYVNPAFCRLSGRTRNELIGKPFTDAVFGKECLALLERVYRTGEPVAHVEPEDTEANSAGRTYTMWPTGDAEDRPVEVMMLVEETTRIHQQAVAMNQQLLLSGVHQHELREMAESLNAQLKLEIAERERMERALVNSEKLAVTARFALTMAHEINNPLAAMTNLVFLLSSLQTSPQAQAFIAMLDDQLLSLSRIATHMLKFHRDGSKLAEFKLNAVLREVSNFYRPQAEKHGIVVHQRFETDGTILGFRSEIVQVVTNLLLNALDATPPRGQVILHLYPAPRWLCEIHASRGYCLSIADTGSGIAPQDRARIYQPFFTTKGERGTGLGLWVSAGIIDRIGGSIRVWSTRRPGRSGTCFSVFLPVSEPPSRRPRMERVLDGAPGLTGVE